MLRLLILILISSMFNAWAQAQVASNYLVSPAGGSFHNNTMRGIWSVGEITGGTAAVGVAVISQGFVYNNLVLKVTSIDPNATDVQYEIYPNPTQDFLYIKWSKSLNTADLRYKIYDVRGVILTAIEGEQAQLKQISMSHYAPGVYVLLVEGPHLKNPIKLKVTKCLSYE